MSCAHCLSSSGQEPPGEMNVEEWAEVAQAFITAPDVKVTGGEPLMPKLLPKTLAVITPHLERGTTVQINTNGWWDWKALDYDPAILRFQVSLDGIKEVHDAIRSPGSFERAVKFIKEMRQRGHDIYVMSSIFPQSLPNLEEHVRFVLNELSPHAAFRPVAPTGRWVQNQPSNSWYEVEELKQRVRNAGGKYIDWQKARCCGAFFWQNELASIAITPEGYVVACPFLMSEKIQHWREFKPEFVTNWVTEHIHFAQDAHPRAADMVA